MAGHRMFLTFTNSANFLCRRNCLVNSNQNITNKVLQNLTKDILPPKPKKPMSPFFEYLNNIRNRIKAENVGIKSTEIPKIASVEWSKLDPNTKQEYQKTYEEKYKIYCDEVNSYKANITPEQMDLIKEKEDEYSLSKRKTERKLKAKALGRPTKPRSAFLFFILDKKSGSAGGTLMEQLGSWKKQWFALTDEERNKYAEKAKTLMADYNVEIKKWEERMMELGHIDVLSRKTLSEHKRKLKDEKQK